jgi:DNA processing protein
LLDVMGWKEKRQKPKKQKELFIELSPEEKQIIQLLQQKEAVHIDEINVSSGLSSSTAAAAILNLELQGVIAGMPGKMYRLL